MKRRHFIYYATLPVSAYSTGLAFADNRDEMPDINQFLLALYEPSFIQLKDKFPQIFTYSQAINELKNKGLLQHNQFNLKQFARLAKIDPIMNFSGWQYTRTELLLRYTSALLVDNQAILKLNQ